MTSEFRKPLPYRNEQKNDRITLDELVSYVIGLVPNSFSQNVHEHVEKKSIKIMDTGKSENLVGIDGLLSEIFSEKLANIMYCGVHQNIKIEQLEKNISLFTSFLTCVIEKFRNFSIDDQQIYVMRLLDKLTRDIRKKDGLQKFNTDKFLFNKKDLLNDFKNINQTDNIISFFTAYFEINIFIVNEKHIDAYYSGYTFNKYKETIILINFDSSYQPLIYDGNYLWNYTNDIFNELITINKKCLKVYYQPGSTFLHQFAVGNDDDLKTNDIINSIQNEITQTDQSSPKVEDIFVRSDHAMKEHVPIESEMVVPCQTELIGLLQKPYNSTSLWKTLVIDTYSKLSLQQLQLLAKKQNISIIKIKNKNKKDDSKKKYYKSRMELIEEISGNQQ